MRTRRLPPRPKGPRRDAAVRPPIRRLGEALSRCLSRPHHSHRVAAPTEPQRLLACLRPGDVLLVEGQTRISVAIKYLTQSTWSHAALYVGAAGGGVDAQGRPHCFVEADLGEGMRLVGIAEYAELHCRTCRPVGSRDRRADRQRTRARRPPLRAEERDRPQALPAADPAGAHGLAPAHARARQRRPAGAGRRTSAPRRSRAPIPEHAVRGVVR